RGRREVGTMGREEKAERYRGGQDRFCRSAFDSERLKNLRQRTRSKGEKKKQFQLVSEKYGRESINTENYIPPPPVIRSRPRDVDRSCLSDNYFLRVERICA